MIPPYWLRFSPSLVERRPVGAVQIAVAQKFECVPVETVGAGFGHRGDTAAGVDAVLTRSTRWFPL